MKKSLGNKGALLYSPDGSMCALRGRQPGQPNVRAVLRRVAPYKGVPPLRCHSSYPSAFCSGNRLLAQSISTAKPENSISSRRPSTENVGGLFLSIIYQSGGQNHARKKSKSCKPRKKRSSGSLRRSSTKFSGLRTAPPTMKRVIAASGRTGLSPAVLLLKASHRRQKI